MRTLRRKRRCRQFSSRRSRLSTSSSSSSNITTSTSSTISSRERRAASSTRRMSRRRGHSRSLLIPNPRLLSVRLPRRCLVLLPLRWRLQLPPVLRTRISSTGTPLLTLYRPVHLLAAAGMTLPDRRVARQSVLRRTTRRQPEEDDRCRLVAKASVVKGAPTRWATTGRDCKWRFRPKRARGRIRNRAW